MSRTERIIANKRIKRDFTLEEKTALAQHNQSGYMFVLMNFIASQAKSITYNVWSPSDRKRLSQGLFNTIEKKGVQRIIGITHSHKYSPTITLIRKDMLKKSPIVPITKSHLIDCEKSQTRIPNFS